MDDLLHKSQLNIEVAELLYERKFCDSACHPMYYACLQLITHKLIKKGITLERQSSLISGDYKGNSHRYWISESYKQLNPSISFRERKAYKDNLYQLKELREKSDYKEQRISEMECFNGINLAKQVIQQINSI